MPLGSSDTYEVLVKSTGDTKGIKDTESALRNLDGQTDKSHGSFLKLSAAVAAGEAAFNLARIGIQKTIGLVKDSVEAYKESENVQAQLKTVLDSTHNAAGVHIDDLNEQAKALQKLTRYSDEAIGEAQGLLLTFTEIKGPVVKEATETVLNMSTALGQDLKSSSIQLGKALNDPITGITALRRVGVNFNDSQKETIKHLVETGQKAKAQAVILKELQTEFGGSAVAAGKTFAGSMDILKNQVNDVQESLGKVVIDGITPFVGASANFISSVDWESVIDRSKEALKNLWKELDNAWQAINRVYQQVEKYLEPKLRDLLKSVENLYGPVKKFVTEYIFPLVEILGPAAGKGLVWVVGEVIDALNLLVKIAGPVFQFLDDHKGVVIGLATAFGVLAIAMGLGAAFDALAVGFATLQLVTIPSLMTTLGLLGGAFIAAFPVVAVAAAIGLITVKFLDMKKTIDDTNNSLKALDTSTDASINKIQDAIKSGKISKEKGAAAISALGKDNATSNAPGGNALSHLFGYASGGFTGAGDGNDVAGIVHKGEYVVPKKDVNQSTGAPKTMGGVTNHFHAPIYLSTSEAVKAMFQTEDRNSVLRAKGMSVVRV